MTSAAPQEQSVAPEPHRGEQEIVLLQVVDGAWEGWRCMAMEEFLQRLDLGEWRDGQLLIGTLMPRRRVSPSDPSQRSERAA